MPSRHPRSVHQQPSTALLGPIGALTRLAWGLGRVSSLNRVEAVALLAAQALHCSKALHLLAAVMCGATRIAEFACNRAARCLLRLLLLAA